MMSSLCLKLAEGKDAMLGFFVLFCLRRKISKTFYELYLCPTSEICHIAFARSNQQGNLRRQAFRFLTAIWKVAKEKMTGTLFVIHQHFPLSGWFN